MKNRSHNGAVSDWSRQKDEGVDVSVLTLGKKLEKMYLDELNNDNGVSYLIEEQDKLFEKHNIEWSYAAYMKSDKFYKDSNMNMSM